MNNSSYQAARNRYHKKGKFTFKKAVQSPGVHAELGELNFFDKKKEKIHKL